MLLTSYLDLELAAPVITGSIQRLFDASFPCVPGEMLPGLFLDHVEIGAPALTRSAPFTLAFDVGAGMIQVPGYGVDLNIPITLVFATEAAIRAGGVDGPTPVQNCGVIATYRLLGDAAQGAGMQLTFVSHTAVTPLPDAQAQQTLMFMLGALFVTQNRFIALPLGALGGLLGEIPPVRNVAVASDIAGTRLVIRVELDAPGGLSTVPWEAFLGSPPNRLGANAWALVLSPRLMETLVEATLDRELNDSNEVEIDEPTDAHWIPWFPVPMLMLTASIELIDKCPTVTMDIGVDIEGSVQIGIQNGQLVTTIHFDFDLIDSDVLLCGLVGGLFFAVAGALFGPIGAAIGGGLGLIFNFLVVPVGAQLQTLDEDQIPLPANFSIVDQGERHVTLECAQPLPVLTTPLLGQLATTTVLGGSHGLQILGTTQPMIGLTQELTLVPTPLSWAQRFSCATKSATNEVAGGVGLYGALSVCPPVVLDDPLSFFTADLVTEPALRVTIRSNEALRQAYNNAGVYSCHLLIQTNRGVRFVDLGPLGPPPAMPDAAELEGWWVKNCLQALTRVWTDKWHPEWVIDPPPEGRLMHWWRASVQGFVEGDRLELHVGAREHIAATAEAIGHAGVDAVIDPLEGQMALRRGTVNRRGAVVPHFHSEQHRLAVMQRLLVRNGSAAMPMAGFGIAVLRTARGELVVTASSDGLRLWRTGGAFGLDLAWEGAAEIDGIATSGAMLIAHGADGLRSWSVTGYGTLRSVSRIAGHFSRIVVLRGHVAALSDGELRLFDVAGLRRLNASRAPAALLEDACAALTRPVVRPGDTRVHDTCIPEKTRPRTFASDQWFTGTVRINRCTLGRLEQGGYRLDTYGISKAVSPGTILGRQGGRLGFARA